MLQILNNLALICIYASLTAFAVGCQSNKDILANTQTQQLSPNSPTANTAKQSSNFIDNSIASLETTVKPHSISDPLKTSKPQKAPLFFEMGLDKANGAFSISQSAQSIEDWKLVASLYRDAIALLREVERDSSEYNIAQNKISEYQQQIKYAQRKTIPPTVTKVKSEPKTQPKTQPKTIVRSISSSPPYPRKSLSTPLKAPQNLISSHNNSLQRIAEPKTTPEAKTKSTIKSKTKPESTPETSLQISSAKKVYLVPITQEVETEVFTVPITRRMGGTPIIEVIFNGQQTFEMIVDTGASGTVITQKMAKSLNVVPVGKAQANTASAKSVEFPIGIVNSIEVSGAKANKVVVAIAGAGLEVGLLGHDFFGDYDLTIKRDMVEFRPQTQENSLTQPSESVTQKKEVRE